MMAHNELCFQRLYGIQSNTNNDQNGGTTQSDAAEGRGEHADDDGEHSDNTEEDCTDYGDLLKHSVDKIGSRLAGTIARNGATLVLQVIGHFNGIELGISVEEGETDDHDKVEDHVNREDSQDTNASPKPVNLLPKPEGVLPMKE